MGPGVQRAKERQTAVPVMPNETRLLNVIEQHRKTVLSVPFILAAILAVVYAYGGNDFRRVLDFMSPGHFFGH